MTIRRTGLNITKDAFRNRSRPRSKKTPPEGFSDAVKEIVDIRSGGYCEIGPCRAPIVHYHHRRPRGLGGTSLPWVNKPANALGLCLEHHNLIESRRILAQVQGWLISQHGQLTAVDVPVMWRGRSVLLADDGRIRSVGGEA